MKIIPLEALRASLEPLYHTSSAPDATPWAQMDSTEWATQALSISRDVISASQANSSVVRMVYEPTKEALETSPSLPDLYHEYLVARMSSGLWIIDGLWQRFAKPEAPANAEHVMIAHPQSTPKLLEAGNVPESFWRIWRTDMLGRSALRDV